MSRGYDDAVAPSDPDKTPLYPINSVDNAIRLLLMLGNRRTVRVSEVSAELNVVRSTAHRLLAMLSKHALAERDPQTKTYRAGPALIDLGLSVVRGIDVRALVRPHLERLCEKLGETAHLMVLEEDAVLFLDGVETDRLLRISPRIGTKIPAYSTAGGRALLAELAPEELGRLFPRPPQGAPRSRKAMAALLADVHERGFAVVAGDGEPDITSVATVLRTASGQVRGAIGVSAPTLRLEAAGPEEVAEQVLLTAREASADLP